MKPIDPMKKMIAILIAAFGIASAQDVPKENLHVYLLIGLVVNAKGGTKIEQWEKGTRFYKEAVLRAKEAQATGTLKGILWHQGESNARNPEDYLKKLEKLVENHRKRSRPQARLSLSRGARPFYGTNRSPEKRTGLPIPRAGWIFQPSASGTCYREVCIISSRWRCL